MKRFNSLLAPALALVVAGFCAETQAHEITLTTVIRDFSQTHPDFEGTTGNDINYVGNTLGIDGKPVYVGGAGTLTTSGAANYNQWYNDVPGVNKSTNFDLVLSNGLATPGGVYLFQDTTFFPIDNQLLGNEGRAHNFHFTLELHTAFTYQPGQNFSVTADDDLIIFIDGRKVLDLGGIHAPLNGTLNVDSLGLTVGQAYHFDLFFAERHTSQSALKFATNIQFVPEPATVAMALLMGFAALRRRRS